VGYSFLQKIKIIKKLFPFPGRAFCAATTPLLISVLNKH
jgi:hypothetical protein